jgi:hypothetical protein
MNKTVLFIIGYDQENAQHRTKKLVSLRGCFAKLNFVTKSGKQDHPQNMVVGAYPNPFGILRVLGFFKLKNKCDKLFYFPSARILYVRKAVNKLQAQIKKEIAEGKKCCIITCVPHHDIAIIGLKLKKKFQHVKWIIDWQDLWSYDDYYFQKFNERQKRKLLLLEKEFLKTADINVVTNSKAKDVLVNNYKVNARKVVAINHPFDIKDKAGIVTSIKKDRTIHIGFLGSFYKPPKVPGDIILNTMDALVDLKIDIRLHIIGDNSEYIKKSADGPRKRYLSLYPSTSHKQSLSYLKECDFLLLFLSNLPNCNVIVHGKLPHYLMLKIPIISIVPDDSAVAEVITQTKSGYVIPSNGNVTEELYDILQKYNKNTLTNRCDDEEIDKYSWGYIYKKWLEII